MKIIIDNHEPKKLVKYLTSKLEEDGHNVSIEQLLIGDIYIPEASICIERKTVSDFCGSIADERLFTQLESMKELTRPCLIIVGQANHMTFAMAKHMNEHRYLSTYRTLVTKWHFPVIKVENNSQMLYIIKSLIKHYNDPEDAHIASVAAISKKISPVASMLSCVPGIGSHNAQAISAKYPALMDAINALKDGSFEVKGIGKTRAEALYKALIGS